MNLNLIKEICEKSNELRKNKNKKKKKLWILFDEFNTSLEV